MRAYAHSRGKLKIYWPFLINVQGQICDFDWREMEALMFLSCIVVIKTRSALSWYQTYSTALQFAKVTSAYLFFRMNVYVGLFYWNAFS